MFLGQVGGEEGDRPQTRQAAFRLESSLRIEFVLCHKMISYQETDSSR